MQNIVAGSFEDQVHADRAAYALRAAGFAADAITTFALNAPGQHEELSRNAYAAALVNGSLRARAVAFEPAVDSVPLPPERATGVMLAVHAPDPAAQERALHTLVIEGARDLETADGTWRNGSWIDFDPVALPPPVDQVHPRSGRGPR